MIRFLLLHNTISVAKNQSIFSAYDTANLVLAVTLASSHKKWMNLIISAWYPQLFSLTHTDINTIFTYMCAYIHTNTHIYTSITHHLAHPNQVGGWLNSNSFCLQNFPIKPNNTFQNKRKKERQKRERNQHCWMYMEPGLLHFCVLKLICCIMFLSLACPHCHKVLFLQNRPIILSHRMKTRLNTCCKKTIMWCASQMIH